MERMTFYIPPVFLFGNNAHRHHNEEKKSEIKLREYKQPQTLHDLLDNCKKYNRYEIENKGWYEIGGYAITGADVAKYKKIKQLLSEGKIIEPINSLYSAVCYKED